MPLFARRPAMIVLETGEVAAVLSECSQRLRGKSSFSDPSSKDNVLVCFETPHRNERLAWLFQTFEGQVLNQPTITPVLVLDNDSVNGANPKTVHYLRDAQGLEIVYFPTTKEFNVLFWWNLFTPTTQIPDQVSCVPVHLIPEAVYFLGEWSVYQDVGGNPLQALGRSVDRVMTDPIQVGPNSQPVVGVFGRKGTLAVDLQLDPSTSVSTAGVRWKSATVRIVLSRREVPNSIRQSLNIPLSNSSRPDAGLDPLLGPYRDGNPRATVKIAGQFTIGQEVQPLQWEFNPDTTNPYIISIESNANASVNALNPLTVYTATVRFQDSHQETNARVQISVFIDNLYIPADNYHSDGFTSLFFAAVDATLLCSTSEEGNIENFYSTYKNTPIIFTLPLDPYEPHSSQLITKNPTFNYAVGDPPVDPGGGWAGIYNRNNYSNLLSVAGASPGKDIDPFQFTDVHKGLPQDPGLVNFYTVQKKGALINLASIDNSLDDYTQHLYHQREIQGSRMASRVLMSARGRIQNLILQEQTPGDDDIVVSQFGGLTVGDSQLTPGVSGEQYQGENFVTLQDTNILFPFGVALPGFVSLAPGDIGHQFTVSGGQAPYSWCLRTTRSSAIDPARVPIIPGNPSSPYLFDIYGNLVSPEPTFPVATQGGGMPSGMLLNQNGLFYGTPAEAGTYLFRLHVKDSNGLRGEATVRFIVLSNENQSIPCSESRGFPVTYKTTITRVSIPSLSDSSLIAGWRGKVSATGGQSGKYLFYFPTPNDPPNQLVPSKNGLRAINIGVGSGEITLLGISTNNFTDYMGVWLFDIQATELSSNPANTTCDRRAVALSIGTTQVAGIPDQSVTTEKSIPDGLYQNTAPSRPYLVLDPPTPVRGFIQGKNVYLQGSLPLPLRPDLGGYNVNPGIVTSVNPGTFNPVQVIGLGIEEPAPSFYHMDWVRSNPVVLFREMFDRFDPVPVTPPGPPLPPGSPPLPVVEGSSIDDMIPVGKRIRPLWPV